MTDKLKYISKNYPDTLKMDGFDDCIIGICARYGQETIIAYDYDKVINKMITEWEMSHEDAVEYYNFNQIGAWMGDTTPCFVEVI